ncbi:vWA domain-containing protein [Pleionea mediterranea]|uniref:Putative metal-dependent peptidase n=1 Tax=Pleionea mediterranea TaxID=523701 RepID=A0A316F893_9GAMM|nr:VWA-like domain-containing protein [Pleionea mediterranea]PWK42192.1 putative metal-dependent peptidase [Pleionea mediterranea]
MESEISSYLISLRKKHPFFATLSLYMDYQFTGRVEYFDVYGKVARINPDYFSRINSTEKLGTLLHLTLHCALLHGIRRGNRDDVIWNIAADIVVNNMIEESDFERPPATAFEPRYSDKSVEYIYTVLLERARKLSSTTDSDLFSIKAAGLESENKNINSSSDTHSIQTKSLELLYPTVKDIRVNDFNQSISSQNERNRVEAYWKNAILSARAVDQMSSQMQGDLPLGLSRAIQDIVSPQLDWKTVLWRYMTKTPYDYSDFDRRFIHKGLYLEQLQGESLTVYIAVDTSGSVGDEQLAQFRAEIESILSCYSCINGKLYFVDADVYGPYDLLHDMNLVDAEGGGGTDFRVFFRKLEETLDDFEEAVCIYLTDGYGDFPSKEPKIPVLWVATDDAAEHFPFGEVTRLI